MNNFILESAEEKMLKSFFKKIKAELFISQNERKGVEYKVYGFAITGPKENLECNLILVGNNDLLYIKSDKDLNLTQLNYTKNDIKKLNDENQFGILERDVINNKDFFANMSSFNEYAYEYIKNHTTFWEKLFSQ